MSTKIFVSMLDGIDFYNPKGEIASSQHNLEFSISGLSMLPDDDARSCEVLNSMDHQYDSQSLFGSQPYN